MLRSFTAGLRYFFATLVAGPLLLAAPVLAAPLTGPTTAKAGAATPHQPAASRSTKRPAAAPVATAAPVAVAAPAAGSEPADTKLVCLAGTVLSADGLPCPGACVFPVADTHRIAVTDAKGNFQLQVPAGKPLNLQADYFGLGSSRVALSGQQAQPLRITLGQ